MLENFTLMLKHLSVMLKHLCLMLKHFSLMRRLALKPSLVLSDHFADVLLPFSLQQKEIILCRTIP